MNIAEKELRTHKRDLFTKQKKIDHRIKRQQGTSPSKSRTPLLRR